MRIETLYQQLELEPQYTWMFKRRGGHFQCFLVTRVIGGETVYIRYLFKNLDVPVIQSFCCSDFVGVV
jgi:hypothetical protein